MLPDVRHARLAGFLFGFDQNSVCRNINPLQPLLAGILRVPERRGELEPDEIRELFFDATGRVVPRPSRRQKRYYSGKKKRHTLQHQVIAGPHKLVYARGRNPKGGEQPEPACTYCAATLIRYRLS